MLPALRQTVGSVKSQAVAAAFRCFNPHLAACAMHGYAHKQSSYFMRSGEPGRIRTFDPLIKSQLLCQLSYGPTVLKVRANIVPRPGTVNRFAKAECRSIRPVNQEEGFGFGRGNGALATMLRIFAGRAAKFGSGSGCRGGSTVSSATTSTLISVPGDGGVSSGSPL